MSTLLNELGDDYLQLFEAPLILVIERVKPHQEELIVQGHEVVRVTCFPGFLVLQLHPLLDHESDELLVILVLVESDIEPILFFLKVNGYKSVVKIILGLYILLKTF